LNAGHYKGCWFSRDSSTSAIEVLHLPRRCCGVRRRHKTTAKQASRNQEPGDKQKQLSPGSVSPPVRKGKASPRVFRKLKGEAEKQ
jgi:hypothetical protein